MISVHEEHLILNEIGQIMHNIGVMKEKFIVEETINNLLEFGQGK